MGLGRGVVNPIDYSRIVEDRVSERVNNRKDGSGWSV